MRAKGYWGCSPTAGPSATTRIAPGDRAVHPSTSGGPISTRNFGWRRSSFHAKAPRRKDFATEHTECRAEPLRFWPSTLDYSPPAKNWGLTAARTKLTRQQTPKSSLHEMVIGGQCVGNVALVHDQKADGIVEGIRFVQLTLQQPNRFFVQCGVNPHDLNGTTGTGTTGTAFPERIVVSSPSGS